MADFPKCLSDDSLYEYEQNEKKRLTQTSNPKIVHFRRNVRPSHTSHKLRQRPSQLLHVQQWRDHRHRLKQIASNLDNKPPRYQAARQTGVMGLYNNAITFMSRTKANMQMLMELSHFLRTRGAIQTFRSDRLYTTSSLAYKIKTLERVEEENRDIAKRLLDVVSQVDTGLKVKSKTCQLPKKTRSRRIKPFTMDEMPLKKYEGYNFEMPQTDEERWLLFRPLIYFDIYLKDTRPLGRIVVELFTEAAPVVVLELVRSCVFNLHNKFSIRRVFPDLWLDAELPLSSNSELRKPLEYDAKVIDHGASSYVLSFSKDYLKGFHNNLCFSLSFKSLNAANGSRIGFGRVIKNSKIIDSLQSYGTKNGVLRRGILFTGCGVL